MVNRYCQTCGRMMTCKKKLNGYDVYTGHPQYDITYKCPAKKWYSFGHMDVVVDSGFDVEYRRGGEL